jgi:hypothetical protein
LVRGSIDEKYAKAHKRRASVPRDYVSTLQADLITLGYLKKGATDGEYGSVTERAIRRFQRHANRIIRVQGAFQTTAAPWIGVANGVCDSNTAKEVHRWIEQGYSVPLDIYEIVEIEGGSLRDDVADLWETAVNAVVAQGGIIVPQGAAAGERYSRTWSPPSSGFNNSGGNSKTSLHYTGRAIDLNWRLADPIKGRRWWIVKETDNGQTVWRIFCKSEKQDGTQGAEIKEKTLKHYQFADTAGAKEGEEWMPAGYYLDLTGILETNDFHRIHAQKGWDDRQKLKHAKKREWWHFNYIGELRETFLDEMELIGYTEHELSHYGWTQVDLDRSPG